MTIRSHAPTPEYRDGWDRVFGKKAENRQKQTWKIPAGIIDASHMYDNCYAEVAEQRKQNVDAVRAEHKSDIERDIVFVPPREAMSMHEAKYQHVTCGFESVDGRLQWFERKTG